jgi:hypothetical protein
VSRKYNVTICIDGRCFKVNIDCNSAGWLTIFKAWLFELLLPESSPITQSMCQIVLKYTVDAIGLRPKFVRIETESGLAVTMELESDAN